MGVKLEFFSCIGAELQDYTFSTEKNSRLYFYRAYSDQTIEEMLVKGFFNEAVDLRTGDLILLYNPKQDRGYIFVKVISTINSIVEVEPIEIKAQDVSVDDERLEFITGKNLQEIIESTDETFKKFKTEIATVYRVKGSVASYEALPSSGNVVGDVWNVLDTGANYVWTTDLAWDKLSETIDLSPYVKKTDKLTTGQIANGAITAEKLVGEPTFSGNAGKALAVNQSGTGFTFVEIFDLSSAQTITGKKTFTQGVYAQGRTGVSLANSFSGSPTILAEATDTNKNITVRLSAFYDSSNTTTLRLQSVNNGQERYLDFKVKEDGTPVVATGGATKYLPGTSDNSTNLATTEWVNNFLSSKQSAIITWGLPDYSAEVVKATGEEHIAETDGIVYGFYTAFGAYVTSATITVDGVVFTITDASGSGEELIGGGLIVPVSKGQSYILNKGTLKFYPLKGAK